MRRALSLGLLFGGGLGLASSANAAFVHVIAATDAPAAGITDATFADFTRPIIGANGRLAFVATVKDGGTGVDNNVGIWTVDPERNLSLLARTGSGAPGGGNFAQFSLLAGSGNYIAFSAALKTEGDVYSANDTGLWGLDSSGSLVRIAREGSAAPGVTGGVFSTVSLPDVAADGQMAFKAEYLKGGYTYNSIWRRKADGGLALIASIGDSSPGIDGGSFASWNSIDIDNHGGVVSYGTVYTGGDITTSNNQGIWRTAADGATSLVARKGIAHADLGGASIYQFTFSPEVSSAGHIAFTATLTGGGLTGTNDQAILLVQPDNHIGVAARESDPVPGVDGVSLRILGSDALVNAQGMTAFNAVLKGISPAVTTATDTALFQTAADGALNMLAREGFEAPDTNGALFGEFNPFGYNATLNDDGYVFFKQSLKVGGDVTAANDVGLWAAGPDAELQLLLREGQDIRLADGSKKTLSSFDFYLGGAAGYGENTAAAMKDVAVLATFTDGSKAIVVAQVPEPATFGLLLPAAAAALLRRRSRKAD